MRPISLSALVMALVLPGVAAAQNQSNGIYLQARGGAAFLTDSDVDSDDLEGLGFSGIEVEFDTDWLVEGAAGYAHDSGLRGAIALGYRENDLDPINADFGASSVSADVEAEHESHSILVGIHHTF